MLLQKLQENLFILVPLEAILGVADLKTFKMQLAEEALINEAIAFSEDELRPISVIARPLDQATSTKKCESSARS